MSSEFTEPSPYAAGGAVTLRRPALAAIGAMVGGLASISCCVLPLLFVFAGISGAWIGNLTALSPWQPAFIAVALGSIAYGHWSAYRARHACAADGTCARPLPRRLVDAGLWTGTVFVAIGAVVAYLLPLIVTE